MKEGGGWVGNELRSRKIDEYDTMNMTDSTKGRSECEVLSKLTS